MVCSVEDFGGQSNEQFSPVEDQEGSFPWKSWSPEWLPFFYDFAIVCCVAIKFSSLYKYLDITSYIVGNLAPPFSSPFTFGCEISVQNLFVITAAPFSICY